MSILVTLGCFGVLLGDFFAQTEANVSSERDCKKTEFLPQEGDNRARSDPSRLNLVEKMDLGVIYVDSGLISSRFWCSAFVESRLAGSDSTCFR